MAAEANFQAAGDLSRQTVELINEGLNEFSNQHQPGINGRSVVLVGNSGTGKTTIINVLADRVLRAEYDDEQDVTKIFADDPVPNFNIGDTTVSETSVPRGLELNGVMFWDTPGLADNRSEAQEIANAVCTKKLFDVSTEVKILLVATQASIDDPRAIGLMGFVDHITRIFADQIDRLTSSLSLVVSHASPRRNAGHIQKRIQDVKGELTDEGTEAFEVLDILEKSPIAFFRVPQEEEGAIDTTPAREGILNAIEGLEFAEGVDASVSLSPRCHVVVSEAYTGVHNAITDLADQMTDELIQSITDFTAPFREENLDLDAAERNNAREGLVATKNRLQALLDEEYTIETVDQLVLAAKEIAEEYTANFADRFDGMAEKLQLYKSLEEYLDEGTQLPIDVVGTIKESIATCISQVEAAIHNINLKDQEAETQNQTRRAEGAIAEAERQRQRAIEAERRQQNGGGC